MRKRGKIIVGSFVSETDVSYFAFLEALERAEYPCRNSITCCLVGEVGLKGVFSQVIKVRGIFLCLDLDSSMVLESLNQVELTE